MPQTSKWASHARAALLLLLAGGALGLIFRSKTPLTTPEMENDPATVHEISTPVASLPSQWPMFHGGPELQGTSSTRFPARLALLWTHDAGDSIKSSAAVADGRVIFGCDDGRIIALDVQSGSLLWSFPTEAAVESSPCILDASVFAGSSDGFLYSLDTQTGLLNWRYETGGQILGGVNWCPAPDGESRWIIVGSYDNVLHCVEAATGKGMWTYTTDNYINGTPAISGGMAIFGGCDSYIHLVSIAEATAIARIDAGSYMAGSAAVYGDRAYAGNYSGDLIAINLATHQIKWTFPNTGQPFFSSPAVNDERVVIGSRDKHLYCLDRHSGKKIWAFPTQGDVDSSPVICDDKILAGSNDGRLYLIDLMRGERLWSWEIGGAITASPAVADGKVFIGSENGYMHAFGPDESQDGREQ